MDLNRLYFNHQASLIAADRSRSTVSRREHLLAASAIATHIGGASDRTWRERGGTLANTCAT